MRPLILGAALALLALSTGCQSPHAFNTPDPSWKMHVGQLKHTNNKRTLVGEVVVQQRGAKEFQLDFLKGGSFPIISIRQDADSTRAEGILARHRWQGAPASAPQPLRPWLALRDAFAQPQASPAGAFANWQGEAKYENGRLGTLSLTFPHEDQRFLFQFHQ